VTQITLAPYDYAQGPRLWEACAMHLATVKAAPRKVDTYRYWVEELLARFPLDFPLWMLDTAALTHWSSDCANAGNRPATIKAKMSLASGCFKAAKAQGYDGPVPVIPYPHVPKATKWWLKPQLEKEVLQWCWKHSEQDLHDLVVWTVETGLRLEETMRCHSQHFMNLPTERPELDVPGTKTSDAQAMIPISQRAARLAIRRLARDPSQQLFGTTSLGTLARRWRRCRKALGIHDHTATLKAMRRAFARKATINGMPLPILQQAMRHSQPETTMEYLRLTGGGYTVEEMRRYL
jgi:integrase